VTLTDPADPGPWANQVPNTDPAATNGHGTTSAPAQVAPHDRDAEASLLSAAMLDPGRVVPLLETLAPDALYHPAHVNIAVAILELVDDTITPDPVTVAARLRQTGDHQHAAATLLDVAARAATPSSAPGYAQIVRDHHRRRTTLALAAELTTAARDGRHGTVATLLEHALATVVDPADEPCASSLIDWTTVWDRDTDDAEWLAEPIVARGRGHAIYATAKAGKSLLLLEVAAALATGRPVLEQPATPPRRVAYFDLEMTDSDLVERLTDLGYSRTDDLSHLAYYMLPNLPPLDTAEGGRVIERIVAHHQAELVVFDTTSRIVQGAENDADTFRAFYRHTGQRLKAAGVTYVRLDHAGKDVALGQRGSSAKADDVDVVWEMTAADGAVKLKATHARMSWVDKSVVLARQTEPQLRHVRTQRAWLDGCTDTAAELDDLEVPVSATITACQTALRDAGKGCRRNLVADAVRWRRERSTAPDTDRGEF
jgi:hypothetical protein